MIFEKTPLEGLLVIQPRVFTDERGYFFESYNENSFQEKGLNLYFKQDNQSKSSKNVLRGLHFQNPPFAQGKLVRVIQGAVLDVAVDIRKESATYGQYFKYELTEDNKTMMYIPEGFAHGFLTLEDETIFSYKCTEVYHPESESGILWNDPELNIDWGITDPIVTDKDRNALNFKDLKSQF